MRKPMPIAMVATAIFALANCAKADIDSAQEQYDAEWNLRGIVIHNPTAAIGEGEKQVKTPWMIMTPDGKSAFANDLQRMRFLLSVRMVRIIMHILKVKMGIGRR